MVSTAQILKEYKETPWDLRTLKFERSTFEIVEDITPTTDLKETKIRIEYEKNGVKAGFDKKVILVKVRVGLMVKSLGLEKSEYIKLVCLLPPEVKNYKGCSFYFEGDKLTYLEQTTDAMRAEMQANIDRPIPDRSNGMDKIVSDIQQLNKVGVQVDIKVLTNICDAIQPGKAIELIQAAKTGGYIVESNGIYRAP